MKKLYIECSYLSDHTHLNTGIQRVVRKVVENMQDIAPANGYEPHLLSLRDSNIRELSLESLYPTTPQEQNKPKISPINRFTSYLKNLYYHTRLWLSALIPYPSFQRFILAPHDQFGLNYIIFKSIYYPSKMLSNKIHRYRNSSSKEHKNIEPKQGDILIILDSSWYMNIWGAVDEFKSRGVKVYMVVYDLIPISNPEFCDDFLAVVFKEWVMDAIARVDGYISISKTVRDFNKDFVKAHGSKLDDRYHEYFYLGADFKHHTLDNMTLRDELKEILKDNNTYLSVSTIEPRKNHKYILDAFDKLWEKGLDIKLLLIGRRGWKVEELIDRIMTHPQKDKRLFYYDDINDLELDLAYEKSKALIFASIVEGFGLPIVESFVKSLPVLASDTPIHREVGGDNALYFDLSSSGSLVELIEGIEENQIELPRVKDYQWLTWRKSVDMLMQKIKKLDSI